MLHKDFSFHLIDHRASTSIEKISKMILFHIHLSFQCFPRTWFSSFSISFDEFSSLIFLNLSPSFRSTSIWCSMDEHRSHRFVSFVDVDEGDDDEDKYSFSTLTNLFTLARRSPSNFCLYSFNCLSNWNILQWNKEKQKRDKLESISISILQFLLVQFVELILTSRETIWVRVEKYEWEEEEEFYSFSQSIRWETKTNERKERDVSPSSFLPSFVLTFNDDARREEAEEIKDLSQFRYCQCFRFSSFYFFIIEFVK